MLFDLENDPHEQTNVANKHPEIVNKATHYYMEWLDEMLMTSKNKVDPLWTVLKEGGPLHARGGLKKYCEYLKQTNREWAIDKLYERHPNEAR